MQAIAPLSQLGWLDLDWEINTEDQIKFFVVDAGLYTYDQVTNFKNLISFHSRKMAKTPEVVSNIPVGKLLCETPLSPQNLFSNYAWDHLKNRLKDGLRKFAIISGILIGMYGIVLSIKSLIMYMTG